MKKMMTAKDLKSFIDELGLDAVTAFTDAGNTLITNREGIEVLKEAEAVAVKVKFLTDFMSQVRAPKKAKKPHHKYPSNYTKPRR